MPIPTTVLDKSKTATNLNQKITHSKKFLRSKANFSKGIFIK
ncbi:hypothetical protein LEP1GSC026_0505 [Leptospira interrogans str. 2002000623]|nr:hypothetical protein LEP1GSC026_0505 [Leptospira interrogans str. 2002000623]